MGLAEGQYIVTPLIVVVAACKVVVAVTVRVVKVGVEETAIVEVPEMTMLEPAVNRLPMSLKAGASAPLERKT